MISIWVTTQFEGFHSWGNAPEEVKFLRDNHRHIFKVKVTLEVKHDDREVEFFIFKKQLEGFIQDSFKSENVGSCEMIANIIKGYVKLVYPGRKVSVEVSEDGENGACVT